METTTYTLIDGKKISADIKAEISVKVAERKNSNKKIPHLAIILVGDDGASQTYVDHKVKACKEVGFHYTMMRFADTIAEDKLMKHIDQVNKDQDVDGFIVQLPLPAHITVERITEKIRSDKDVDGFTNHNFGSIISKNPLLMPATPFGVMELLRRYNIETEGKNCVIVGASRLVGAPLSMMLVEQGRATVTICHKYTKDLAAWTKQADILVVAVGKPGLITANMVKKGAVVIDVGTTRVEGAQYKNGYSLKGDVEFKEVAPKTSFITPVPGGVGPMTIASLLMNTLKACENLNP
ncbi:MAG: bifunctional 5,10-methylene-tetrahydrofolate dehydrogenase/5,10-methylene-tetrahydrofolate cyclohydrolase [Cytophagales bacterium]|nr:bifunctional 5,10-methylene-tetrahydrofolate dehydrogenase/5,10-methylene-tetrahydrofolate cyclohydrolase [Cytophagales bacterium]MCA6387630.1 bifunctional 5,10-methylene-tetrahydrofolate dehydrogenase/5,10-methylene-tetrahydrofolate cyclohydrolase [Cytophagales bacterium]MCA6392093.1 bifunctional 5,10-methylene-tetrahydrofolate dehydrogenase/5,10-methylene-tetrahydrofolate cyclohydrolase [Cytophagales bacterium]MCA6393792.1 bifunctional 5,10-methylene-tetrahydrofolate dehydrogenase/5,10-meth